MTHPQVVVAVPARLESARLPGKLLAEIAGKPMLQHVLERCQQARGVAAVLVCTDSEQVRHLAQAWGVSVLMTSPDCSSGSERLASVVAELELLQRPPLLTPVYPLAADKIHDPNVVKVLRARDGRAITFSRSALPHLRGVPPQQWGEHTTYWGHVGLYGYRADVLAGWAALPTSPLEDLEKLEQLRLIDAGIPLLTYEVDQDCLSVDTPEQLEQARALAGA